MHGRKFKIKLPSYRLHSRKNHFMLPPCLSDPISGTLSTISFQNMFWKHLLGKLSSWKPLNKIFLKFLAAENLVTDFPLLPINNREAMLCHLTWCTCVELQHWFTAELHKASKQAQLFHMRGKQPHHAQPASFIRNSCGCAPHRSFSLYFWTLGRPSGDGLRLQRWCTLQSLCLVSHSSVGCSTLLQEQPACSRLFERRLWHKCGRDARITKGFYHTSQHRLFGHST